MKDKFKALPKPVQFGIVVIAVFIAVGILGEMFG